MKKESKEMLRTIISNQHLIMKALKIEVPVAKTEKATTSKATPEKSPVLPAGKEGKKVMRPAASKKPVKRK